MICALRLSGIAANDTSLRQTTLRIVAVCIVADLGLRDQGEGALDTAFTPPGSRIISRRGAQREARKCIAGRSAFHLGGDAATYGD